MIYLQYDLGLSLHYIIMYIYIYMILWVSVHSDPLQLRLWEWVTPNPAMKIPTQLLRSSFWATPFCKFSQQGHRNPSDQTGWSETGWTPLRSGTPDIWGSKSLYNRGTMNVSHFFVVILFWRWFPSAVLSDYFECINATAAVVRSTRGSLSRLCRRVDVKGTSSAD